MSRRSGAREARVTTFKLCAFAGVMILVLAGLIVVFSEYRSGATEDYAADFEDVSGLEKADKVRIAGVEVGKVGKVELQDGNTARVEFSVDDDQTVLASTVASVRYENLTGDRYLELTRGTGDRTPLQPGATLPREQTRPALDLDALLGGFRPLFKALDPGQVNALSQSIVQVFQGEAGNVQDLLAATSSLTSTLADRDQLIGSVIDNLTAVLTTVSDNKQGVDDIVVNLQQLISGLAKNSAPIGESVSRIDDASASMSSLLADVRPAFKQDVQGLDKVAGLVNDDQDYVDNVIQRLPDDFQKMQRLGVYGGFFNFYLCGVVLRFSDPTDEGKTLYNKQYEQTSGRCEAK